MNVLAKFDMASLAVQMNLSLLLGSGLHVGKPSGAYAIITAELELPYWQGIPAVENIGWVTAPRPEKASEYAEVALGLQPSGKLPGVREIWGGQVTMNCNCPLTMLRLGATVVTAPPG